MIYLKDNVGIDNTYSLNGNGLFLPNNYKKYPIGIDLFAGCGGISLGAIRAGWQIIAAVEYDMDASWTYLYNLGSYPVDIAFDSDEQKELFSKKLEKGARSWDKELMKAERKRTGNDNIGLEPPKQFNFEETIPSISGGGWRQAENENGNFYPGVDHFFMCDIRELTGDMILDRCGLDYGEVDCVFGGPPCQGFSKANKNRGKDDPRNDLIYEFARIVIELKAKCFMFENVPALSTMVTSDGVPALDGLLQIFEDADFGTFNAMKKSLLASAGLGVVKRHTTFGPKKNQIEKTKKKKITQQSMFES